MSPSLLPFLWLFLERVCILYDICCCGKEEDENSRSFRNAESARRWLFLFATPKEWLSGQRWHWVGLRLPIHTASQVRLLWEISLGRPASLWSICFKVEISMMGKEWELLPWKPNPISVWQKKTKQEKTLVYKVCLFYTNSHYEHCVMTEGSRAPKLGNC